ncbi:hypothetical protein EWM64_g937 [Hericium alpestre]|uniref:Uncharacterized protein n=1 Tax=Hericium alpestre TaxID=135208 RepID=A0A4Z0A9R1_9AGAM|nr:hypothetical protein EWM64_g937 [Hericium alpestre]
MPLCTFLSLADMIMAPEDYEAQESEEDPYAPFAREELEEWKEARCIIQVVLDSNAVALAQVRTLSLKPSLNWQDEDDRRMVDLACIRTN